MGHDEQKLGTQVEDPTKPDVPKHEHGAFAAVKDKFQAHAANPGPAISKDVGNVPLEGTKEERRARAAELNKE